MHCRGGAGQLVRAASLVLMAGGGRSPSGAALAVGTLTLDYNLHHAEHHGTGESRRTKFLAQAGVSVAAALATLQCEAAATALVT